MRFLLISSVIASIFALTPEEKCKAAEGEWSNCTSQCAPECSSPNPEPCDDKPCKPSCVCPEGKLLNSRWECVAADLCLECNSKNPYHEYTDCAKVCGTCTEPIYPCKNICEKGCACPYGHVENTLGQCIRIVPCQKCSGPNEEYRLGVNPCEPSCVEPYPIYIPKQSWNICQCIEGFVRANNDICIPLDDC